MSDILEEEDNFEEEMRGWQQLSTEALTMVENATINGERNKCEIKYGRRTRVSDSKRLWPKEALAAETA